MKILPHFQLDCKYTEIHLFQHCAMYLVLYAIEDAANLERANDECWSVNKIKDVFQIIVCQIRVILYGDDSLGPVFFVLIIWKCVW